MAKYGQKAQKKVHKVMREYKRGKLRSGRSGKKVKSRKQAVAIGLSQARKEGVADTELLLNFKNTRKIIQDHGSLPTGGLVRTANQADEIYLIKERGELDKLNYLKEFEDGSFAIVGANKIDGYAVVTFFEVSTDPRVKQNYLASVKSRGNLVYFSEGTASRLAMSGTPHPSAKGRVSASLSDVRRINDVSIAEDRFRVKLAPQDAKKAQSALLKTEKEAQSVPMRTMEQKLSICESTPNGTTRVVEETQRVFINLPEDIYPFLNREFTFESATSGLVSNGEGLFVTDAFARNSCATHLYEFIGEGTVSLRVLSEDPEIPEYKIHFVVRNEEQEE